MNKPYVYSGLGLLALTAVVATYGVPVTIKTGTLVPDAAPGMISCYTSGTSGELVSDPAAGTAIIEAYGGNRVAVTWPIGWTGRMSLLGVSVIDERGQVVARTGTHVNLTGGYWRDGSFLACAAY
jgi:hypothetical protein